jgi:Mce-associated membrane protein
MSNSRGSRRARLRLHPGPRHIEEVGMTAEIDSRDEVSPDTSPGPIGPAAESDDLLDHQIDGIEEAGKSRQRPTDRLALVAGLMILVVLTGLVTWTGHRAYVSQRAQQDRNLFLHTARQAALNLTTIDYTRADAEVHRILESATGNFYDVFQKQSQPFIDVVTKAQSKSEGTVVEAGLESEQRDQAQVLVAVDVKTTTSASAAQDPRAWRMRITVQKVGDGAKVANVDFVP